MKCCLCPAAVLLLLSGIGCVAETLQDTLQSANVPTSQFSAQELAQKITSYAISRGDPFLLAYYTDDGSGLLKPPLHLVRHSRGTHALEQADLRDISAMLQGETPMDCVGSALEIHEHGESIFLFIHGGPSSGCLLILSTELSLKAALSGRDIGLLGSDFVIVRSSEVHFMSVHPLHVGVFDLRQKRLTDVYPVPNDPFRRRFSRLIKPHVSEKWCMEVNAQCDPENFNTDINGEVAVNESANVFGFEAKFDAAGFAAHSEKLVPPQTVAYLFRNRAGVWEHLAFNPQRLRSQFSVSSLAELVAQKPDAAFETAKRQ